MSKKESTSNHVRQIGWILVLTLTVSLVVILPFMDHYRESSRLLRQENFIRLEREKKASLKGVLLQRVSEAEEKLESQKRWFVSETKMLDIMDGLVAAVRQLGCRVRSVKPMIGRAKDIEVFLGSKKRAMGISKKKKGPEIELKKYGISLSLRGPFKDVRKVLSLMKSRPQLYQMESFYLRSLADSPKDVILDLEVWFYSVNQKPKEAKKI